MKLVITIRVSLVLLIHVAGSAVRATMPTNAILFVAQVPNSNDRRTVSHVGQAPDRGQNLELGCAEVRCEVCICVIDELVQLAAFVTQ